MIIAIDGPAGAGKTTVARAVARALGLRFLDTGAMYRAVTLVALERGIHPSDGDGCGEVARELDLTFDEEGRLFWNGRPGEPDIRSETVTRNVSAVSAHASVRDAVVAKQRELGRRLGGLVAEGRDTATVVFPQADHKFFLIASTSERARRRARELGRSQDQETIQADIELRDRLDTTRAHSPLCKAEDAIEIVADDLDAEQVTAKILDVVAGKAQPEE